MVAREGTLCAVSQLIYTTHPVLLEDTNRGWCRRTGDRIPLAIGSLDANRVVTEPCLESLWNEGYDASDA